MQQVVKPPLGQVCTFPCILLHVNGRGSLDAALRSLGAASQASDQQRAIGAMLLGDDDGRRSLALADVFAVLAVVGVSAALAHIHGFEPPVLHLDLKPANILVVLLPGCTFMYAAPVTCKVT
eukprot:6464152-Amphidinium_carterae.1